MALQIAHSKFKSESAKLHSTLPTTSVSLLWY